MSSQEGNLLKTIGWIAVFVFAVGSAARADSYVITAWAAPCQPQTVHVNEALGWITHHSGSYLKSGGGYAVGLHLIGQAEECLDGQSSGRVLDSDTADKYLGPMFTGIAVLPDNPPGELSGQVSWGNAGDRRIIAYTCLEISKEGEPVIKPDVTAQSAVIHVVN